MGAVKIPTHGVGLVGGWLGCAALLCACGSAALQGDGSAARVDPCQALQDRVCGPTTDGGQAPCADSAACDAARLTAEYRSGKCQSRLEDEARYPSCSPGAGAANAVDRAAVCEDLLLKACGATDGNSGGCAQDATCQDAKSVSAQADDALCRQALGDDTSFPRCNRAPPG